ncbi:DUF4347 domain-containing protein [Gallaecimonas sp. GXIMD4217]|uniref:DUF4347 domain-containing protein n=1 Tax=Gallaecimonas sp. GXIMD4217 TaxID=3131927 RepID=UPI00311B0475
MRTSIVSTMGLAASLALVTPVPVAAITATKVAVDVPQDWSRVLVVDAGVKDAEMLIKAASTGMRVIRIDEGSDGLAQLEKALSGVSAIQSLHILAHGSPGTLFLGAGAITEQSLRQNRAIAGIRASLAQGADIMIYGCELAAGSMGESFVQALSNKLGADVAASTDLTGAESLGGDWELEYQYGQVDSQLFASQGGLKRYQASLSHFRGGSVKWQPADLDGDGAKDDVKFFVNTAWRLNGQNTPNLQSDTGLVIQSDGVPITQHIEDPDDANASYTLVSGTFKALDVDPTLLHKVYYSGGARIGNLINNANGSWNIQTLVNTGAGNQAPGIELPIILEVPQLQADGVTVETNWTYQLYVVDPNGDKLRYRLANLEELGGGSSINAPNIGIDANTGLITWTGSGTMQTGLYSAGFVVEDLNNADSVLSKTHVDLILYLQNKAPTVDFTLSDNIPGDTKTVLVDPDTPFNFSISGNNITSSNIGNVRNSNGDLALTREANGTDYTFNAASMLPGTYAINFEVKATGRVKSYLTINFVVADPLGPLVTYYPGDGAYSVNGGSTFMDVGRDALVSDPDDSDLNGGFMRVDVGQVDGDASTLTFLSEGDGIGQLRLDGSNVYFEGRLIGAVDVNDTGVDKAFKVNFTTGDATLAAVQALIRALQFSASTPPEYGTRNATLVISDPSERSNLFTTTVTVGSNNNNSPVANGMLSNQTTYEGSVVSFSVPNGYFTDADGDSLNYEASGLPSGILFDDATLSFSGSTMAVGTHEVIIKADDGNGG